MNPFGHGSLPTPMESVLSLQTLHADPGVFMVEATAGCSGTSGCATSGCEATSGCSTSGCEATSGCATSGCDYTSGCATSGCGSAVT